MEKLNKFELSILERLSKKYHGIKNHIPHLRVLNREFTGVGMYVNLCYIDSKELVTNLEILDGAISSNENIEIKGLQNGLGYEVDVSEGRLKFIEIITYGENWDGYVGDYKFIQS